MAIERLVTICGTLIWCGRKQSRPNCGTLPESPGWTEKTTENVSSRKLRRAPPEWTVRVLPLHKRGRPQFALPQSVFLFSLLITLLATIVVFLISNFRRVLNVVFFLHRSFNLLKPNDIYICRTAALTSRRYILNINSTNIHTEYFKHAT